MIRKSLSIGAAIAQRTGARTLLALIVLGAGLTGCAGLAPQNEGLLARDMLEIKNKLDTQIEEQTSYQRKVDYTLGKIDENMVSRGEITKNSVDDLNKRMIDLTEEIRKLREQVQGLEFSMGGGRGSSTPGTTPGAPLTPAPGGTGASGAISETNPAQPALPAGGAIDQALMSAQNQFNLGRYAEAREGFRRALELNPAGDKQIDVLFGIAESSAKLKDYPTALDTYKQLIRANPQHAKAWNSLHRMAEINAEQGDNQAALKLLAQFEGNPTYPEIERVRQLRAQLQGGAGVAPTPAPAPSATPAP